ncbi:hypothetical protein TRFO_13773 [Tritrichomonas foetus]|uniref:DDE-1 domain-containing protein n=1 Tax=Tritrichomonas foetus TaxID=1144522 RepID=A0A1J4J995_9EUKA|nr:hypothetical protein TRFO_02304 [Tritrichomonas foetus]OHT00755.1 hypothetical protein TRFO_32437 [Tritrichomonas foetus]OHT15783.1 hypothetical protein TRFO_13773 [Tritrichomonas foetus]|eukprot:OHS93796.1 hypothetical protein TRFO_02304 [Tritrichomonas foetus]
MDQVPRLHGGQRLEYLADLALEKFVKRRPYIQYTKIVKKLEPIFFLMQVKLRHGEYRRISKTTGIPYTTILSWKNKILKDNNWRPNKVNFNISKRVFTDDEEIQLINMIQTEYLDKNIFFSDSDFKYKALNYYYQTLNKGIDDSEFLCSPTFIADFKKRHEISLRKPHLKRRPDISQIKINEFRYKVLSIMQLNDRSHIINMDETCWQVVNANFFTWAKKGSQTVTVNIHDNVKTSLTAIASIDANGKKLPLMIVGKGKTEKCLTKLNLPSDVWSHHSESGWATTDIILKYLENLRKLFHDGKEIILLLDIYKSHIADECRLFAESLKIQLVYIPPGCTDILQPLDIRIFGILKGRARRLWRIHQLNNNEPLKKAGAVNILIQAWNSLSEHAVQSSWGIFENIEFVDEDLFFEDIDYEE